MNNMQNTYDLAGSRRLVQHNVLRNTYWLLALSMVPTIFGAVIGVSLHLPLSGGLMALAFLAIAFGFIWGLKRTRIPASASRCCWASPSSWACG